MPPTSTHVRTKLHASDEHPLTHKTLTRALSRQQAADTGNSSAAAAAAAADVAVSPELIELSPQTDLLSVRLHRTP